MVPLDVLARFEKTVKLTRRATYTATAAFSGGPYQRPSSAKATFKAA